MVMKRILITVDGVLCDFVTAVSTMMMRTSGLVYEEAVSQVLFHPEALPTVVSDWHFWKYVPPRLDAVRWFPLLAGSCLTTLTTSYNVPLPIVRRWLDRYGFAYRSIEPDPQGDFSLRVDHHPVSATRWQGSPVILVAYPYNADVQVRRFRSFRDVVDYCLDREVPAPEDTTNKGVT